MIWYFENICQSIDVLNVVKSPNTPNLKNKNTDIFSRVDTIDSAYDTCVGH